MLKELSVLGSFLLQTFKEATMFCYSYLKGIPWKTLVYTLGYLLLLTLAIVYDVTSTFIILSIFTLMVPNLQKRGDGDLSAYSVFNEGFIRLLGTTTGEDIDNNIRNNRA